MKLNFHDLFSSGYAAFLACGAMVKAWNPFVVMLVPAGKLTQIFFPWVVSVKQVE